MTDYYQLTFTHKDAKETKVNMVPEKLNAFFEAINSSQIYWYGDDETTDLGYWINIADVRFVQVRLIKGEEKNDREDRNDKGDKRVAEVSDNTRNKKSSAEEPKKS